jgi:hypothetical protein
VAGILAKKFRGKIYLAEEFVAEVQPNFVAEKVPKKFFQEVFYLQ